MTNISPLLSSIAITPASLIQQQLADQGQKQTQSLAQTRQGANNGVNLFAFDNLSSLLYAQESLLDPSNKPDANSQALQTTVQAVSAAYVAAAQLTQPQAASSAQVSA